MNCSNCHASLLDDARFCSHCGSQVANRSGITTEQEVGTVRGSLSGTILGTDELPSGFSSRTHQRVDTVEQGGSATGTIVGGKGTPIHVGGQQQYGDDIAGDKREISTGGSYVEGQVYTAGGDVVGRDKLDARGTQGLVNLPSGPVNQSFGPQRNVTSGGGDYAEGNIDEREGAFVPGGTVYGSVVGQNSGTITAQYGTAPTEQEWDPLAKVIQQVCDAAIRFRQHGDEDVAHDLQRIELDLDGALRAGQPADAGRRQVRLERARRDLTALVEEQPQLQELLDALKHAR